MPTAYVKQNGQWVHPKSIYVKNNGQWKLVKSAWIKDNGTWRLGYTSSTGTVTFSTPSLGGLFIVPEDIYELRVRYPDPSSSTYVTEQTISVNPGQSINYSIGDYGQISSFGSVAAKPFDQIVAKWSGILDWKCVNQIGLITGTTALSAVSVGNATETSAEMATAGIYFTQENTKYNSFLGSLNGYTCSIYVSTIPVPAIQGSFRAYLTEAPAIAGGTTIIETQPTAANNYVVQLLTTDPSGDPPVNLHYYQLNLQQINPITVTWGDWPEEDLYPVSASISLTSISTAAGSPFTSPSGTEPYSVYAGGAVKYSVTTTNLTTGTLYYKIKTTKGKIPTSDNILEVSGRFTATTTFSDGIVHNSYGTVSVNNSLSTSTFTVAAGTNPFLNMDDTSLISCVEIYKNEDRTPAALLCSGPYIRIIPPAGAILNTGYCGSPAGRFGGTQFSLYTVVANGTGGYILTNEVAESESCGYVDPFNYYIPPTGDTGDTS
jgi:hypothetical protein